MISNHIFKKGTHMYHNHKTIKRFFKRSAPIILILSVIFLSACTPKGTVKAKTATLTGKTAKEVTAEMGIGWNLGNTMDATSGGSSNPKAQETSWGNPATTPELIKAIRDKGFKTIRIPTTWANFLSKDGTYTINEKFIARIKEIVDYAYDLDMYVILNLHHEAWVNNPKLDKEYLKVAEQLAAVWSQIADEFADYDQHLIFEAMNEPRMTGADHEWDGYQSAYNAVNYLNQVFAYTIRSNGKGYNSERCLMIPGYAASSSDTILKSISIPTYEGETVKNIIISTHCYSPYNFCLSDEKMTFDPNSKTDTGAIDTLFNTLEEQFLFNDIPVVIGETSATNKDNTEEREKWARYMGLKCYEYGVPIIIWDNGSNGNSGGECHAWINRKTLTWNFPTVVDNLFYGSTVREWGEQTEVDRLAYESLMSGNELIGGKVIWEEKEGHTVAGLLYSHAQPISIPVIRSYIVSANDIAVASDSSEHLAFYLTSSAATDGFSYIPVAPYKTEKTDLCEISYFKYRDMIDALSKYGIDNAAKVESIVIASDGPDMLVYEVDTVTLKPSITYLVNGQSFTSETSVTTLPEMKVLGWYTTKDYREGTEYTGEAGKSLTLYAKLIPEYDEAAMQIYTQKYGSSDPTPEVTVTPDVTSSPDVTVTEIPATGKPDKNDDPAVAPTENETKIKDDADKNSGSGKGVLILVIGGILAVIGIFICLLSLSRSKNKKNKKDQQ